MTLITVKYWSSPRFHFTIHEEILFIAQITYFFDSVQIWAIRGWIGFFVAFFGIFLMILIAAKYEPSLRLPIFLMTLIAVKYWPSPRFHFAIHEEILFIAQITYFFDSKKIWAIRGWIGFFVAFFGIFLMILIAVKYEPSLRLRFFIEGKLRYQYTSLEEKNTIWAMKHIWPRLESPRKYKKTPQKSQSNRGSLRFFRYLKKWVIWAIADQNSVLLLLIVFACLFFWLCVRFRDSCDEVKCICYFLVGVGGSGVCVCKIRKVVIITSHRGQRRRKWATPHRDTEKYLLQKILGFDFFAFFLIVEGYVKFSDSKSPKKNPQFWCTFPEMTPPNSFHFSHVTP